MVGIEMTIDYLWVSPQYLHQALICMTVIYGEIFPLTHFPLAYCDKCRKGGNGEEHNNNISYSHQDPAMKILMKM